MSQTATITGKMEGAATASQVHLIVLLSKTPNTCQVKPSWLQRSLANRTPPPSRKTGGELANSQQLASVLAGEGWSLSNNTSPTPSASSAAPPCLPSLILPGQQERSSYWTALRCQQVLAVEAQEIKTSGAKRWVIEYTLLCVRACVCVCITCDSVYGCIHGLLIYSLLS